MPAAVGELGVDLVGDDQKVVLLDDGHQRLQLGAGHDAARGVVGIGQQHRLGAGGDGGFQRLGGEDEAVLLHAAHRYGRAPRQLHAGHIGYIAGVGDEYLVPFLAHGAHDEVYPLAGADGDDDVLGGIRRGKALFHIAGDERAQGGQPAVARVLGVAAADAGDGGVADVPGGDEVRLAHAQRDGVLHFGNDIEKFADARRL